MSVLWTQEEQDGGARDVRRGRRGVGRVRGGDDIRAEGPPLSSVFTAMLTSIFRFAPGQPSYDRGNVAGVQFFGIASTVLLSVALM